MTIGGNPLRFYLLVQLCRKGISTSVSASMEYFIPAARSDFGFLFQRGKEFKDGISTSVLVETGCRTKQQNSVRHNQLRSRTFTSAEMLFAQTNPYGGQESCETWKPGPYACKQALDTSILPIFPEILVRQSCDLMLCHARIILTIEPHKHLHN